MADDFQLLKNSAVLTKTTAKLELLKQEFKIFKIYDKIKKSDYTLAFDDKGKEVDFDDILKRESELYHKKFGKIHPTLFKIIEKSTSSKLINVAVWVKVLDNEPRKTDYKKSEIDKFSAGILRFRKSKFAEIRQVSEKIAKDSAIKIGRISRAAPVFFSRVNSNQINKLTSNELVCGLFFNDSVGINDLGTSMALSNADDVIDSGFTGTNINVAVWEMRGPDDTSNLVIEEFKQAGNRTGDYAEHARLVCGVIKNIEKDKPHGYAPNCKLYSANDSDLDGLEWAVEDKECSVVNQSFHRNAEETEGNLSFGDIYKDYMIYHYPYPTIIQAAGNKKRGDGRVNGEEFVNHKGFNSLAVGNHNDNASAMVGSSIYRNPNCRHGDRELPEIAANGTDVEAVGLSMDGTSFASPAVAGSAALLQSIDSELTFWPEGSRAILLAGAKINVEGSNWSTDMYNEIDAKDGTGALDIEESANIAQNRKGKNNIASQQGWDIGILDSNDFKRDKNSNFSYKIRVSEDGPKNVKVALAWNSKVDIDFPFFPILSSRLKLDLDLWILDEAGNRVARSTSYDNSYEIAEYVAKSGQELTIVIRKFSGDDWTYFGIAWTVF